MKKTKIALLCTTLAWILCPLFMANSVNLHLPKLGNYKSEAAVGAAYEQVAGNYSILQLIRFVNSYIRFAIGFVCFLFTIINWYKLITAQWDEKTTKDATKALYWSIIGIGICLLAYIIVNVTLRLFA